MGWVAAIGLDERLFERTTVYKLPGRCLGRMSPTGSPAFSQGWPSVPHLRSPSPWSCPLRIRTRGQASWQWQLLDDRRLSQRTSYLGLENGLFVNIVQIGGANQPVEDLQETLQAEVIFGASTMPLALTPLEDRPARMSPGSSPPNRRLHLPHHRNHRRPNRRRGVPLIAQHVRLRAAGGRRPVPRSRSGRGRPRHCPERRRRRRRQRQDAGHDRHRRRRVRPAHRPVRARDVAAAQTRIGGDRYGIGSFMYSKEFSHASTETGICPRCRSFAECCP